MQLLATASYWIRFGAVMLIAALGIGLALRRSRPKVARFDLLFGLLGVGLAVALAVILGLEFSWALFGGLIVAGAAVGALASGRRALVAWLIPVAYVFAAIMILFGAGGAAALGFAVLGFGLALPLGQGIRRLVGNKEGDSAPAVA
jgi:hypothetical protein